MSRSVVLTTDCSYAMQFRLDLLVNCFTAWSGLFYACPCSTTNTFFKRDVGFNGYNMYSNVISKGIAVTIVHCADREKYSYRDVDCNVELTRLPSWKLQLKLCLVDSCKLSEGFN
jgi:hypothetical protein